MQDCCALLFRHVSANLYELANSTAAQDMVQEEEASSLQLLFYLPSFPTAVLYSQPDMPLPRGLQAPCPALQGTGVPGVFETIFDAEVARLALGQETNPCEVKALKLSQAPGGPGLDRC